MNQDLRESLSAVMDDEGDELSLPRVLKTLEQHPEEADTWRRYHVARSVMKREQAISHVDIRRETASMKNSWVWCIGETGRRTPGGITLH